ncbi:H-NS family nucleoid-associated regulatory protein [Cupriavidus sp. NPDC089707]|uniref:H-NS family nucleoid-associated regulatory protein n=1 Tax=Cupriavidus sp. NPDC089707 TaxID=3363963 RepID=UPI0037FA925E
MVRLPGRHVHAPAAPVLRLAEGALLTLRPGESVNRNAEGLTWDGQGEMPAWLRRAVNAGQSVEFYRVGSASGYPRLAGDPLRAVMADP